MQSIDRSSILVAVLLISLGVLFLASTIFPGFTLGAVWPIIFFVLALGFYLPSILWKAVRRELAALYIPGSIMLALGVIFVYNTTTQDWASWAYAWLLIPAGVGLGLMLAAWIGQWGQTPTWVGIWMVVVDIGLFSIFAIIFGNETLRVIGPILLMLGGMVLLWKGLRKR